MFTETPERTPRRVLITGASGMLGPWLCREAQDSGLEVIAVSNQNTVSDEYSNFRVRQDLCDREILVALFAQFRPAYVIHAAALADPALCEDQPILSRRVNVELTRDIAQLCEQYESRMAFTSTDLVFDGKEGNYSEDDPVNPINRYGEHKAEAERVVRESCRQALVLRLPFMFGVSMQRTSPLVQWVQAAEQGKALYGFTDEYRSPVDYQTAARGIVQLLTQVQGATLHLGGIQTLSRCELMQLAMEAFGLSAERVEARRQSEGTFRAARPADVSLDSRRARNLGYKTPFVKDALQQLAKAAKHTGG